LTRINIDCNIYTEGMNRISTLSTTGDFTSAPVFATRSIFVGIPLRDLHKNQSITVFWVTRAARFASFALNTSYDDVIPLLILFAESNSAVLLKLVDLKYFVSFPALQPETFQLLLSLHECIQDHQVLRSLEAFYVNLYFTIRGLLFFFQRRASLKSKIRTYK